MENPNIQQNISESMGFVVLLNSSCQAIVEIYVDSSSSQWAQDIENSLGSLQDLVRDWRLSGYLYFSQDILGNVESCASLFVSSKDVIESLFNDISKEGYSLDLKKSLINKLQDLASPIQTFGVHIQNYEDKLRSWTIQVQEIYNQLAATVSKIQDQEADLQSDINETNSKIEDLQAQITKDRDAIAQAKAQETAGIVETIVGVACAPLTGGASLILAGIGVASIAAGEVQINGLKYSLQQTKNQISSDLSHLASDQAQIASLRSISASAELVLTDIQSIESSLDNLRTQWDLSYQEVNGVIDKISKATTAPDILLQKLWFDASYNEWLILLQFATRLKNARTTTSKVTI